jgi:hypothetical protein
MKQYKNIIIVILALFYLLVILRIIILYLVPNTDLLYNHIQQNLISYVIIIKIILILMALSVIPAYYSLKKNLTNEMPLKIKNMFYVLIFGISALIPLTALLNTYLTGDLILSSLLLLYGILFTLTLYKHEKW